MRDEKSAGDVDYRDLAVGYARHRQPDARIARQIDAALGTAGTVLNIGAGTGSYEPAERLVVPIEPSAAMRDERPTGGLTAIDAVAEAMPFDQDSFDAAMAILTIHQWRDTDQGLREMRRVARGPVVIMTFDSDAWSRMWLIDYIPELYRLEGNRFPSIQHVCDMLGGTVDVSEVPIPLDCSDGFAEAFYGRPEALLDPAVRRAQSGWAFLDPTRVEQAVDQLRSDLRDGTWDRRHGPLRTQASFVGALRILTAHP